MVPMPLMVTNSRWLRTVLIVLLCGCATGPRRPDIIRVLVYNIHAGKDAAGVDNLERVSALITSTNADLVLLQEVDRGTTRSGKVDQVEVLTRRTKLHGIFGKSLDYQGGEYGIAILSRWPITGHEVIHLPVEPPQTRAGGSVEPRVALIADTGGLRILNTHLDASKEDTYRLQEADHLLEIFKTRAPRLIGGDFNSTPDSAVQARVRTSGVRDAWTECGANNELTFPADVPVKRIDYLFLTGRTKCVSASVIESSASDHRPVLVALRLTD